MFCAAGEGIYGQVAASGAAPVPVLTQALEMYQAQKLPEAIKALDDYTRVNPKAADVPAALLLKGKCEAQSKSPVQADAEKTWGWLIHNYPHSDEAVQAYQELTAYYANVSQPDMAEKTQQDMIRLYPNHPFVIEGLGAQAKGLMTKGQYKEALVIYEKLSTGLTTQQRKEMAICQAAAQVDSNPQALLDAAQEAFMEDPDGGDGAF